MKASMAEGVPADEPDVPELGDTSTSTDQSVPSQIATPSEPTPTLPPVLTGRAQMEQERIARQKAREGQAGGSKSTPPSVSNVKPALSPGTSRIATMADLPRNAEAGPSTSQPTAKSTNGNKAVVNPPTHHPLQSTGPFPSDAAGEYYLDGEMRHNALSIGRSSTAPTFSPQQIVGKVS